MTGQWFFNCAGCGRPAAILADPDGPIPAGEMEIHSLRDLEGRCSACDLLAVWSLAPINLAFTNAFELKVPKLVDDE